MQQTDDEPAGNRLALAQEAVVGLVRTEVIARPGSFVVDVGSLVAIAWGVWWFADNDGGLEGGDLWPLAVLLLVLAPALVAEARRVRRGVALCLGLLPLGALFSFAFAVDRSQFAVDAIALGALPVVVLAASRLSRRRWSAIALFAIVIVAALTWSWLAGLKWWGWTDLGSQPRWELVSWRNPSGILSAAFGVWAAGFMLAGKRSPTLVAGALGGLCLAGAWLSGSRAAIIFGAAGLLGVLLVVVLSQESGRARHATSMVGRLAGLVAAAVVIVAALQLMLPTTASTPLESRGGETVTGNAVTRLKHWEAAIGMFVERPLTGTGIGSYRAIAPRHNPPDGRLTSAAHNEWLETLGEGGLVLALPMFGLGVMFLGGVWRSPQRLRSVPDDAFGLQRGLVAGAVGASATILAHASIDFDLRYPTLLLLAATGAGVLLGQFGIEPSPAPALEVPRTRPRPGPLLVVPTVVLLALGALGAREGAGIDPPLDELTPQQLATVRPPWDTVGRVAATERLMASDELDAALVAAQGPASWNPGDPRAWMNLARLRYLRGEMSAAELLDTLEPPPTALSEWSRTAVALFTGGDYHQAEIAARRAIDFHPDYRVWGVSGAVATGWAVVLRIAVLAKGCDEAEGILAQAEAQDFDPGGTSMAYLGAVYASECPAG